MTLQHINEIKKIIKCEDLKNFMTLNNLIVQAYTRRSFSEENPGHQNNEILETIGDTVINTYVTRALVEKYSSDGGWDLGCFNCLDMNIDEGTLTDLRKEIVCGKNLAKHAVRLELIKPEYWRLGKGDILNKVYEQESVQEDLLESIVGAVAIAVRYDSEFLYDFVKHLLDLENSMTHGYTGMAKEFIYRDLTGKDNSNPVNYLQELWRGGQITMPLYKDEGWQEGSWIFSASIPDKGLFFKEVGKTKKEAKMRAATQLYNELTGGALGRHKKGGS